MSTEEKVCIKILGKMITYGVSELAKFDDEIRSKLKGMNEVLQWKIGDDIAFYTEIENENVKGAEGIASNPTLTIEISDVTEALNLLTGKKDMSEIVKIAKLIGDASKFQQLTSILLTIREYLSDLMVEA
ncbi:MAG: hypothetical protein ACFFAH_13695 [Promethearchaeota archaeon]